jgi:aryl-alcohol dehydrogenase-like predicted oxidoreductase
MRARGDRPTLTTKVFHSVVGHPEDVGLAPERVRRQLHGSLERLGVEAVDLYLTHEPDPAVPIARTLAAFGRLRDEGLVGAFGVSNVSTAELRDALAAAPVAVVQNEHSLLRPESDELLALCVESGIAYQAFSPLAGGWLAGKYRRGEPPPTGSRMTMRPEPYLHLQDDRVFDALEAFELQALERETTPAALAVGWLLAHPQVTAVVVGPRRPEHLRPALEALELRLSPPEYERLGRLFSWS